MKKTLRVAMMVCIGILALVASAHAVVTYNYTGNTFTLVSGQITTSDYLTASLSFDSWLPANYDGSVKEMDGYAFEMESGNFSLYSDGSSGNNANIQTDSEGNIVGWYISVYENNYEQPDMNLSMWSCNLPEEWCVFDAMQREDTNNYDILDEGEIQNAPGTWSVASVVPEPISSTLFLAGGARLGFRRFRKSKLK